MWEGLRSDPQAPLSIFPFSWCMSRGGSKVSSCVHVGIQVGGLFAKGPKQMCFEPYVDTMGEQSYILLSLLCIWQYLHVFDVILCSFLHLMCSTGRLTVKCLEISELWYVAYVLAYDSVLHLTICRITWSLWRGTRGLTKLGSKFVS